MVIIMWTRMDLRGMLLCVASCVFLTCVSAAPLRLFYPYGTDRGDNSLMKTDDVSSAEMQLQAPMHFYDGFYTSIFVNSNGHLSFETEFPAYLPNIVLPMDNNVKIIAAFLSDIDLTKAGDVFFRESWDNAIIQRATLDIQGHFSQFQNFDPLGVFIATWDRVPAFGGNSTVVNTFQIVIASDETDSFVIFNYLDNGIQWIRSVGKMASARLSDPPGQAGFDSGTGRLHTKLPYAGTEEAAELSKESNVNEPGVWMYHIGKIAGGNVVGPDLSTGDVEIYKPEVDQPTCLQGGQECHKDGSCQDYEDGFCCACVPPYIGNGMACIAVDVPQKLIGKVSGNINGVQFDKLDMHAFVVTKEGRVYTAVSRVPEEISSHMMTLNTIGGVIGWMFGLRSGVGASNGFELTGGTFKRVANITYQKGGNVIIDQEFFGQDASNNIQMRTNITGTIPDIGATEKITIDDYVEEYHRVDRDTIHSRSSRKYRVNNVMSQYTWDQTITFSDCEANPAPNMNTMRHSVTRNFIIYDNSNQVVRFAMSNAVTAQSGADPCRQSTCAEMALCVPEGETYSCKCRTGFVGDGTTCTDLDECAIGLHTCDVNARCINVPGSFQCFCEYGYGGDGIVCTRVVQLCDGEECSENARCVMNSVENRPMCECNNGFTGDGVVCRAISFNCNEADICHENADCIFSPAENTHICVCVEGYSGDGVLCEPYVTPGQCDRCDPNAECLYDSYRLVWRCSCKPGFTGDERSCAPIEGTAIECESCDPNARCYFDDRSQRYGCQCNAGYMGTGYECDPYDCRDEPALCSSNAQCRQDASGQYSCVCNPGFTGDGRSCQSEGCEVRDICDVNAMCVPDPRDTSRHMCRCRGGFSGDGLVCIRRVIPCNEVNNCSPFAECVPDPETRDFRCRCKRGYEGDGVTCTVRGVDCNRDRSLCDPNAVCILNVDMFVCVCNQNYRGDGTTCSAIHDERNYLLFSRGYSIHKVPYTQNGIDKDGTRVLYVPGDLAVAVSSDCAEQSFYWTDIMSGKVSKADIDGTNKVPVANGFQSPEGIAIDWLSRNMYVTDSGLDIIAVVNLNGTNKKTLISENLVNPRAIIVDPQRGMMYWTDWYRGHPTIEMANMDGTDRKVFVETELGLPNGLTIDYHTQTICWGDAGVNKIECIRSDGVGRRVVTEDAPYPFDLTFNGNTIYWSDWTISGVPSVDRNGGETAEPLSLPVGGNGRMYGITTIGEYCPRAVNACYRSNGGCSFLCLPTPNGGRTCACPDDIDDDTCEEIGAVYPRK